MEMKGNARKRYGPFPSRGMNTSQLFVWLFAAKVGCPKMGTVSVSIYFTFYAVYSTFETILREGVPIVFPFMRPSRGRFGPPPPASARKGPHWFILPARYIKVAEAIVEILPRKVIEYSDMRLIFLRISSTTDKLTKAVLSAIEKEDEQERLIALGMKSRLRFMLRRALD
jgi:hypothetical protein